MTIQDPKLKVAMKEVQAVLQKWDIAALVILADGLGHSECRLFIDTPTWSQIRFLGGGRGINTKAYMKTKPAETQMSINAVANLADVASINALQLINVMEEYKACLDIEEGPATHEGRNDDPT